MQFSSLPFLFCFLPLFFAAYFLCRKRSWRNVILPMASLIFYAWGEPVWVVLLVFSTLLDYVVSNLIEKSSSAKKRKLLLLVSLVLNLAILAVYKYSGFIVSNINLIIGLRLPVPAIALPIGISFYTFQTMSYTIDVYRGKIKAQRNFMYLLMYVSMFPQLVAGPIVRYSTIETEIVGRKENIDDFAAGMRRVIVGLAKKVLIANSMASLCDGLLGGGVAAYGALGAWTAMLAYTLQIYFDFSAYSDMAIGLGRMLGFHYNENFDYPYIAKSVSDFWRRWHISLSSFFRDYVYISMGGNRVSKLRWVRNVMVVWFLTGLWHGASWNFVIWGVYFGLVLLAERLLLRGKIENIPVLNHVFTMFLVILGWVIFRADDMTQTGVILSSMFFANGSGNFAAIVRAELLTVPQITAAVIGIAACMPVSKLLKSRLEAFSAGRVCVDLACICALAMSVASLINGSYNPFIYFRF
ncbi:MAG: MBOAT family protein [Oscillospiraceae bacterium]|nr:MBOAT family protein [Oscillospiraceae bacterium]